jgi:hypothetical protein
MVIHISRKAYPLLQGMHDKGKKYHILGYLDKMERIVGYQFGIFG